MGIIVNGTTIPENTANVLTVNGINITDVILNGTNFWHQSLGPVSGWSGNSLKSMGLSWYVVGINTSGLLYRYACGTNCSKCTPSQAYGAWITAGGSSMLGYGTSLYNNTGFYANGNTLQYTYTPIGSDGYVNYDVTNGFTGGSKYGLSSNGLITSNKLITFTDNYPNANGFAWISLT